MVDPIPRTMLRGDCASLGFVAILAILPAGLLGIACYLISGNGLDLFVGGLFCGTLLSPPLAAIAGRVPGAVASAAAISVGIGCSWFLPVWEGAITFGQWMSCVIVLWTLLLALSFGLLGLMRFGCSAVMGAATMTILGLGWLSCPIWLSGALSGSQLRWSLAIHPVLAINGIVHQLGFWTEQQVAYGLTNLGQDVQYQLPQAVWPVIAFQGGVAMVMLLLYSSRIAPRSTNQIETEASSVSNA